MGWEQQVIQAFDQCIPTMAGHRLVKFDAKTGKLIFRGPPLAPLHHVLTATDLIIVLDANGKFRRWDKVEEHDRTVVAPITPAGRSRTSDAKFVPTPLVEALKYITAGIEPGATPSNPYIQLMDDWINSDAVSKGHTQSQMQLKAVQAYLHGGTIITDFPKEELDDLSGKRCRFVVEDSALGDTVADLSKNHHIWEMWEVYMNQQMEAYPKGLDYITGKIVPIMEWPTAPSGVYWGSKAKIIMSSEGIQGAGLFANKKAGFVTKDSTCQVGEMEAQKIANMLRWLVETQSWGPGGTSNFRFLAWTAQAPMRNLIIEAMWDNNGSLPTIGEEDASGKITMYNTEPAAKGVSDILVRAAKGAQLTPDEKTAVAQTSVYFMALRKTCDGRIAVCSYGEMAGQTYIERLLRWTATTSFETYTGTKSLTIRRILRAEFGEAVFAQDNLPKNVQNEAKRIWDVINMSLPFPRDIANAAFCNIINPTAVCADLKRAKGPGDKTSDWECSKIWGTLMETVCAILRKYKHDAADESIESPRDLLYGELLALMERAEIMSMYIRSIAPRTSNGWRSMKLYFGNPVGTSLRLRRKLEPYIVSARVKRNPTVRVIMQRIEEIFESLEELGEGERGRPIPLGYDALLKYNEVRKSFYQKCDDDRPKSETA